MPNLDSTAAAVERRTPERESTAASVSDFNGTPKRKKKKMKKKNKMQGQQEFSPVLDPMAAAGAEEQGEAKRVMEEREATNAAACALSGSPKCSKKKMRKKNKMQEKQESPPELDSTAAAEVEEQGRRMVEREATDAAACALNGSPKCSKKKMRKKNKMQEKQESQPVLDTTAAAEVEEQGRRMEELEATDAAACALNGSPKCSKKKMRKKNKMQEKQEVPPDLDSTAAAEVEEQGRGMEEREVTDAVASAFYGKSKCKKMKKKNKMQEQQESPPYLDSMAGKGEQGEPKGMGMEERESADAGASGTAKCDKEEGAKVKDSVMLKEEAVATVVSASEGTPKCKKRKRKKKMQDQPESKQASSGVVGVDKIVSNKSENGCAERVEASGHADVSTDPINGEDPSCAQSNANVADVLVENCSENSSLLEESSAGRKRRSRKRKRGSSSRGPGFSSENGGMVSKLRLDSSTHHDLSCICASCLVEARKEKIKSIYSPRGSLVRFQRKKLLILDLNGLLADINQDYHNAHKAHAKVRGKLVFRRPYCDDFLRFCFQNFELGIWSSRKRENVNSVVNILMRDLKQYLLFCWDMSYCTRTGCNTVDNKHKPLVLKELKKLWNKEDPNLPWEQGEFSPSNTLLVDDSPYKALCNPPNTAIFPQPYSYQNQRDDYSLGPGGDLRIYLERIASAHNVQDFVRDNPFGQNSITESDPNWSFYVQIVGKVEKLIVDKVIGQIVDKVEDQIVDKVEDQIDDEGEDQIVDKSEESNS